MEKTKEVNLIGAGKVLVAHLLDSRQHELELTADLSDEQLLGSSMRIVEPPIWEMGHVGWFQDRWILQNIDNLPPVSRDADDLYDSFNIPNAERRQLLFPTRRHTLNYMADVLERVIQRLDGREPTEEEIYFYRLLHMHEDMHGETMAHIRQTLEYPVPQLSKANLSQEFEIEEDFEPHFVNIPGGEYQLGGTPELPFVFDNEKWAHPLQVKPYQIGATPVTTAQYRAFVEAGGYQDDGLWDDEGLAWLKESGQQHPVYWQKDGDNWIRCYFDTYKLLEDYLPMIHVNWYEASAYAKWAGGRLPSEAEWELAASAEPAADGKSFSATKRMYPWGDSEPVPTQANLDARALDILDVRALPAGDSAFGLRQMVGNVWEWTAATFDAFPGYIIDLYDTYSEPSFGQQKVLRGGCFATRGRVIRNTFRNFYTADRNNIFAGFRIVKD